MIASDTSALLGSPVNSKMATSFLEAASNICSSPTSSKCIIGSVDCRSLRSESICSLGSLVSENQERPKNLCSMSSQGSNASPVTAQTLSLQFHKTRFCPFFAKGHCRKGADCTYAHDRRELKTAPDLFKTKLCEDWQKGNCHDVNCRFAHGRQELRFTDMVYKTRVCHFWATGDCNKGKLCRHAHGYQELRTAAENQEAQNLLLASSCASMSKQESSYFSPQVPRKEDIASLSRKIDESIGNDDNWRSPPKPALQDHDVWKSLLNEPAVREDGADPLSMLNRALAALNLKGDAAVQAANLQQLISSAVDSTRTPPPRSTSGSSLTPDRVSFKNDWNSLSKSVDTSVGDPTDADSSWTPLCKETPSSTPRYSRTSSMPDNRKTLAMNPPGLQNVDQWTVPQQNNSTDLLSAAWSSRREIDGSSNGGGANELIDVTLASVIQQFLIDQLRSPHVEKSDTGVTPWTSDAPVSDASESVDQSTGWDSLLQIIMQA